MKKYLTIIMIAIVLLTSFGINTKTVYAYAYNTNFESVVHIQNIGTDVANLSLTVYDSGGEVTYPIANLPQNGSTSLYIGNLVSSQIKGSAVISSDQPLATVISQVSSGAVRNQPLSSGFTGGSPTVLIPTVLWNKFFVHSVFSVQNVDSVPADLTFTFIPLLGDFPNFVQGDPIIYNVSGLPRNQAEYIDMGKFFPRDGYDQNYFNGSVFIEAKQTGTETPGSIVATSMELEFAGNNAYAFDGALETANKIFLPSAQCRFGPNRNETTAYAVSNPNGFNVSVKVTYSSGIVDGPYTIGPYAKRSFDGCHAGNRTGFLGSAIAETTNPDHKIHAVGKIYGGGLYPAHLGFIKGSSRVALPYVRWTDNNWNNGVGHRSYIAIQNIGTSNIAAGAVTITYYDKNGVGVGTHTLGAIGVGNKVNSHPLFIGSVGREFGSDGGGSAIVSGPDGSQLAVVVRVQRSIGNNRSVGEDYTGIPIE